jgi:putative transposase
VGALFRTGRFQVEMSEAEEAAFPALSAAKQVLASQRLQMLRKQVVGQLQSFMANRANEFVETVMSTSSLSERTRHELLSINKRRGWFSPQPIHLPKTTEPISPEVRHLARRIMHGLLARHRRPSFDRLNPWIDQRQVTLTRAATTDHADFWLEITTLHRKPKSEPQRKRKAKAAEDETPAVSDEPVISKQCATVHLPVASHPFFERRGGALAQTVQLIPRERHQRHGDHGGASSKPRSEIVVGVVSDMAEAFAQSRAACRPRGEELCLDWGLRTMLATNAGDLLGRDWIERLKRFDARISGLAARLQSLGLKPNRSRRYRSRVAELRGYIATEVGRVLNRAVARPGRRRLWCLSGSTSAAGV